MPPAPSMERARATLRAPFSRPAPGSPLVHTMPFPSSRSTCIQVYKSVMVGRNHRVQGDDGASMTTRRTRPPWRRRMPSSSSSISTRLYTAVIGDILDELGRVHQFLPPQIRPLTPQMRIVGPGDARASSPTSTVRSASPSGCSPRRSTSWSRARSTSPRAPASDAAMWGEILTATAQSRGAVGAVVDGYHRDTEKVLGQGFPVFSHGNYAQDSSVRTIVQRLPHAGRDRAGARHAGRPRRRRHRRRAVIPQESRRRSSRRRWRRRPPRISCAPRSRAA